MGGPQQVRSGEQFSQETHARLLGGMSSRPRYSPVPAFVHCTKHIGNAVVRYRLALRQLKSDVGPHVFVKMLILASVPKER